MFVPPGFFITQYGKPRASSGQVKKTSYYQIRFQKRPISLTIFSIGQRLTLQIGKDKPSSIVQESSRSVIGSKE